MTTKIMRKIVKIDEEKCDGCGSCANKCAEGALEIIDGKARLVSEVYCDGLGACLGECPRGAITIEDRPAAEFDLAAVEKHLHHEDKPIPCGCPSMTVREFEKEKKTDTVRLRETLPSRLTHFPVQLTLVPPHAPFLKGADLLLAADCSSFCYAGFHEDFLKGRALLIACPKLDDFDAHLEKLTEILREASPKSLTVLWMEVPCCGGLTHMAKQAVLASGKNTELKEIIVGVRGEILKAG